MGLQEYHLSVDRRDMAPSIAADNFSIYLWRSPSVPGTLYLAEGLETAETLCRELSDNGYIVKVVRTATDEEFELCEGRLCPA